MKINARFKIELIALSYFFAISFFVFSISGAFFLFIFTQFLRWVIAGSPYAWPKSNELMLYAKAVLILTLVTTIPLWYSEKKQSGR